MALGGVAASPRDVPCCAVAWIAAKRGAGGYWMQFMVVENGWNWWLSERPEFFNFYWTISNQAIDKYNKLTQINGIWAWNNCDFANKNRSKSWFWDARKDLFSAPEDLISSENPRFISTVPSKRLWLQYAGRLFFKHQGGVVASPVAHFWTIPIIATESIQELVETKLERNAVDDHAIGGKKCSWWSKPGFLHMFPRIYPLSPKLINGESTNRQCLYENARNPVVTRKNQLCMPLALAMWYFKNQTQLNGGFSSYSNVYGNTSCSHQMVFLVLPCMSHRPMNPAYGELWGSKVSFSLHQQGTTRRAVGFHATCRGTDCTGKFAPHKAHLQILRAISDEFWGK